jgi:6-pyruvoyltetrahydropterin/6-carboxytetrahydropterin synthase
MFDHTLLVAEDDPHLEYFKEMANIGSIGNPMSALVDLRVVPAVGCERFAQLAYDKLSEILIQQFYDGVLLNESVTVKSVEVFEHGANSAIYEG